MSPPPATRPQPHAATPPQAPAAPAPAPSSPAKPPSSRRRIPGWFILVAVAITLVVTVWTVQTRSPARLRVDQQQPGLNEAMMPVVSASNQLQPVAATRGIPKIVAGTRRPHNDRGPCTRCHTVMRPGGTPMPIVTSDSWMPHAYPGGMCINCHQSVPPVFGRVTQLAGTPAGAAGAAKLEAVWLGMEVAPITPVTGRQFATPAGLQGVVVTEVEGRAQAAGIQAGDVVIAINSRQVTDIPSFNTVTGNGMLPRGRVQVLRGGRLAETWLEQTPQPPMSAVPSTTAPAAMTPGAPVTNLPAAPAALTPLPPRIPAPAASPTGRQPIAPTAAVVPLPPPVQSAQSPIATAPAPVQQQPAQVQYIAPQPPATVPAAAPAPQPPATAPAAQPPATAPAVPNATSQGSAAAPAGF